MKLLDRITVGKEVFEDRGILLPMHKMLNRFADIGGFSFPLPENIHIYYFFTDDGKKMIVEYYVVEREHD